LKFGDETARLEFNEVKRSVGINKKVERKTADPGVGLGFFLAVADRNDR
jgi:hypothetical protein